MRYAGVSRAHVHLDIEVGGRTYTIEYDLQDVTVDVKQNLQEAPFTADTWQYKELRAMTVALKIEGTPIKKEAIPMSSLLSYYQLQSLLKDKIITFSSPEHINGASIDVTLGRCLLIERVPLQKRNVAISLRDREELPTILFTMNDEEGYTMQPGEFLLAHTQQVFNLPISLTAKFFMKSTPARMGLENLNATWCDPGWNGSVLTLELCNCTRYTPITIRPGDRIGQMTFQQVRGVPKDKSYATVGHYNGDKTVHGVKR